MQDLNQKTKTELTGLLRDEQIALSHLRTRIRLNQQPDVRAVRETRKRIANLLRELGLGQSVT
ncbi:MAG: hypothetical protein AAB833_00680 [Patescibacteria group bacterium]